MLAPLQTAYAAMPEPRLVVAVGDCAPGEAVGRVEDVLPVAVRVPGCPPAPEQIAAGLLEAMAAARKRGRA